MNRWQCEGEECDRTVGLEGLFRDISGHWALCPEHKKNMEADGAAFRSADDPVDSVKGESK